MSRLYDLRYLTMAALAAAVMFAEVSFAAHPVYRAQVGGPAIDGYDTVAYFTLGHAVRGSAEFQYEWRDTTWYFANADHLAMFVENPERYAPQFGGYCSYAASRGRLYKGHPEVFTIQDGRLYFNNTSSIEELWLEDRSSYIDAAKRFFPELIGENQSRP
ncbi:MAG: YHS domain-containing (seleno)protein [Myxococcota bacterium]